MSTLAIYDHVLRGECQQMKPCRFRSSLGWIISVLVEIYSKH